MEPELPSLGTDPRCIHYSLAHYALRTIALRDPLMYLAALASPDSTRILGNIIQSVAESCAERNEEPDFTADDLRIHCRRVNQYPCVIVEMPPPKAFAEAYFTALIAYVDPSGPVPERSSVVAQYITLECGVSLDGLARTVLGSWTADGTHSNFGDGPNPTIADFLAVLSHFVPPAPKSPG
jgi:hypothetical protein